MNFNKLCRQSNVPLKNFNLDCREEKSICSIKSIDKNNFDSSLSSYT